MQAFTALYRERGISYLFDPGQSLPAWTGGQLIESIRGSAIFILAGRLTHSWKP